MPTTSSPTSLRSRRARALAIGGIVLGLGAVATLASWTDQEWAGSPFSSGHFNLEGSTNGTAYDDHATSDAAATVSFSEDFDNLSPNQAVTGAFHVRLAQGTTTAATVATTAKSDGDVAGLTYGIRQIEDSATCTVGTAGTEVVPADTAIGSASGASTFTLDQPGADQPGAATQLCITVTAGTTLQQNQVGSGTWTFTATSN